MQRAAVQQSIWPVPIVTGVKLVKNILAESSGQSVGHGHLRETYVRPFQHFINIVLVSTGLWRNINR